MSRVRPDVNVSRQGDTQGEWKRRTASRWGEFLTERDLQVFSAAGYGQRGGFGQRPVVLVVDVNYSFCGDWPEPILDSVQRWRNSCGEAAWTAVAAIQEVLALARRKSLPVIYTTGMPHRADGFDRGRWRDKNRRASAGPDPADALEIVREIAPHADDIVIAKGKPSAFFGTLLPSFLADLGADSIVTCGATTSGCVRATVVDGFSYNYRMSVVQECTFDRGEASHWISLFDLDQKYADVVALDEVRAYFDGLPDDLFMDRARASLRPSEAPPAPEPSPPAGNGGAQGHRAVTSEGERL